MTLTLQDNAGTVAGANAYISVADFKAYHDVRGNSYSAYTDTEIDNAIIQATDYVDVRFNFVGWKLSGRDQTTEWPRAGAIDRQGWRVQDIPEEVKDGVAEYALRSLEVGLMVNPVIDKTGREVESTEIKAGPITKKTSYVSSGQNGFKPFALADALIAKLLQPAGMIVRG